MSRPVSARYRRRAALGRYRWHSVLLDGVATDDLHELLDLSYHRVVGALPKSERPDQAWANGPEPSGTGGSVAIKVVLVAAYAAGAVLVAGGLTACGSSAQFQPTDGGAASFSPSLLAPTDEPAAVPTVPDAFAAACGQPGADVTVTDLPVTVSHAQCDLTGVIVHYGLSSITVPSSGEVGGGGEGPVGSTDLVVDVDGLTGDVTIAAAAS